MKLFLGILCLFLISYLEIAECRSIEKVKTSVEKLEPQNEDQQIGYEALVKSGVVLKNILTYVNAETVRELLTDECNEESVEKVVGGWAQCINLTLSLAEFEQVVEDWWQYRVVVNDLFKDIFYNVTECKIHSIFDESVCLFKALRTVLPDYSAALDQAINLLEETDEALQDIRDDFIHCIFHSEIIKVMKKNCKSKWGILDVVKNLYFNNHN